jgi:hypothetical protein
VPEVFLMAHQHEDLVREITTLRAEVRSLTQMVNAMKLLQTAARIVLGTSFTELLDHDPEHS